MTDLANSRSVSRLWTSTLASGLLGVILGVLVLMWPGISILVASVLFGVYLVVSGFAMVVFALSLPVAAAARILMFLSGAASLILAVLAFRHFGQGYAILLLAIWIGVGFVFRGVATTAAAVTERGMPGRGWAIFVGVTSIIAGMVLLAWPFDSIVALALVAGIWLIAIGLLEIVSAFQIRTAAKNLPAAWHADAVGHAAPAV